MPSSEPWLQRLMHGWPGASAEARELPIERTTVGLCFDYGRQVRFESEYLSDKGLEHILTLLQHHGLRATFNCSAKLCKLATDQIHMIADAGHEIAAYGYADEVARDLDDDALKAILYSCREAFAKLRLQPVGFRSRRADCDERFYRELSLHRFLYNSEHDHAKRPYLLSDGTPSLVRVPVCTSDLGYRRNPQKSNVVVSKHHRYLRKAVAGGHFVSIGFHPWLLAEEWQRMVDFEEWLEVAVRSGARIGALVDALPARYRSAKPTDSD